MPDTVFDKYIKQVVNCPSVELGRPNSPCHDIIKEDWATLIGWGNPEAPIVFVGLNPHRTSEAEDWHRPALGESLLDHARKLSKSKESEARHFAYHRRILRELAARHVQVPASIGEFAFFTEVAFCPSATQAGLKAAVIYQCFNHNVSSFILGSKFRVVIALGIPAATICVRSFIGHQGFDEFIHGKQYDIPNSGKVLLTSYHPNARGTWDRSAISTRLLKFCRIGRLSFK